MELAATTRHRRDAHKFLAAALHAADAGLAVERILRREDEILLVDGQPLPLGPGGQLLVAGAGKAATVMARAAARVAGPLLAKGVVVDGAGVTTDIPTVDVLRGGHPLPDASSLASAAAILKLVRAAGPPDVVLFLLSGGASAMIERPVDGLSLDDLRTITSALLASGVSIGEFNTVRKALSLVKGGGIARAAAPAFTQTLAVSDVVGDDPAVIGSAPTVPGAVDPGHAIEVARHCELAARLADAVYEALERSGVSAAAQADIPDAEYRVIASVKDALAGAAQEARLAGYETEIVSSEVVGEARQVGAAWARRARARAVGAGPACCLLAGGETTVHVVGKGRGGRNQELALGAAIELEGDAGITVAAIGTDGRDGPTDAAGAIVDGDTVARGRLLGREASGFLADNDSYTFFTGLADVVTTGPTRTNVMDLHIALVGLPDD